MTNVLLVDDNTMFREMMTIALRRCPEIQVVGEAANAAECVDRSGQLRPDIVLLDYRMPGVGSFRALIERIRAVSGARVLVLSGLRQRAIAQAAAAGGGSGYVLKTARLSMTIEAILAVARGEIWVDPGLGPSAAEIFRRAEGNHSSPVDRLNEREIEVLAFISDGDSNRQIARKMDLSEDVVRTHVDGILTKLGVATRKAATLEYLGVNIDCDAA
jgi:DNA-binding NarL/FixJ family response regulator